MEKLTSISKTMAYKKFKKLNDLFNLAIKLNENAKTRTETSVIECPYCKDEITYCFCREKSAIDLLEKYSSNLFINKEIKKSKKQNSIEQATSEITNENYTSTIFIKKLKSLGIIFKSKYNKNRRKV